MTDKSVQDRIADLPKLPRLMAGDPDGEEEYVNLGDYRCALIRYERARLSLAVQAIGAYLEAVDANNKPSHASKYNTTAKRLGEAESDLKAVWEALKA